MTYDWPGNIRQLRNTVESMLVLDSDGLLDVDDLPEEIAELVSDGRSAVDGEQASGADALIGQPMRDVERYYIQRALEITEGKREEAAALLGISQRTLYRKIKDFDL